MRDERMSDERLEFLTHHGQNECPPPKVWDELLAELRRERERYDKVTPGIGWVPEGNHQYALDMLVEAEARAKRAGQERDLLREVERAAYGVIWYDADGGEIHCDKQHDDLSAALAAVKKWRRDEPDRA